MAQQPEAARFLNAIIPSNDLRRLIVLFGAWKLLLLAVACGSPGDGYDTSSRILFDQYDASTTDSWLSLALERIILRLTRWDGIYFATSSERGHFHEQEWAFSWFLTDIVTPIVEKAFLWPYTLTPIIKSALAGIIISHISHLLAVITLYHLTSQLVPARLMPHRKQQIAFIASCLHIVSPAGLFLSAPYGEGTFALFNFLGTLAYTRSTYAHYRDPSQLRAVGCFSITISGVCFGLATMIRSNGLLSGLIFAWDAVVAISRPSELLKDSGNQLRFVATTAAGSLVALGFAAPQFVAYTEYCMHGNTRPWCSRMPPSIYSWVQDHYWEVGLFKYWTLSNLPLFLLAGPMLVLLLFTGYVAIVKVDQITKQGALGHEPLKEVTSRYAERMRIKENVFKHILPRIALPHLVLAIMALTSFHVQIVNRISSGYPVWYILLAIGLHTSPLTGSERLRPFHLLSRRHLQWLVRGTVMYALVQGGLFASFLPPA